MISGNKLSILYLGVSLLVFISCAKEKLEATDYIKYVESESNGLRVVKKIGDVNYALQYKPMNYVLVKESNSNTSDKGIADTDGMQYYTLSYSLSNSNADILKSNIGSTGEYYERVNYLSYGLQNDVYLLEGSDTLKCRLFNFVRSYGLSPRADFIMAFDESKKHSANDKLVVVEDKVYGGGIIKFKITKSDIANIPELIKKQN